MLKPSVDPTTVTAVMDLAWKLYVRHVLELLDHQFQSWSQGHPTVSLSLSVPTPARLELIQKALHEATAEGVSKALLQIITAIDEIDNSGKKSADTKRHYDRLTEICEQIRSMKTESQR